MYVCCWDIAHIFKPKHSNSGPISNSLASSLLSNEMMGLLLTVSICRETHLPPSAYSFVALTIKQNKRPFDYVRTLILSGSWEPMVVLERMRRPSSPWSLIAFVLLNNTHLPYQNIAIELFGSAHRFIEPIQKINPNGPIWIDEATLTVGRPLFLGVYVARFACGWVGRPS